MESVLAELPEASNFWAGIEGWLAAVPGQEGVLRNSRGITLFVPVDDGFSDEVRDKAFVDSDTSARTIGEHLVVGVVDPLQGTVVTAAGSAHEVTDGAAISGRRLIRSETASNGVIHLIDGPLPASDG